MKVLWFTNTPSLFTQQVGGYNGGGWIQSLEQIIRQREDVNLGVSFFYSKQVISSENTGYFPILLQERKLDKVKSTIYPEKLELKKIEGCLQVIEKFKPDVIHIFGTEDVFGRLASVTSIPVVIHIQGILGPYVNAFFPPGMGLLRIAANLRIQDAFQLIRNFKIFRNNANREIEIFRNSKFLMGRTSWDKSIAKMQAPEATYFHCDEILREIFYQVEPWKRQEKASFTVMSTISKVPYKGFDVILKTALLLTKYSSFSFKWVVYGISDYRSWEKITGINAKSVNVEYGGVVNPEELVSAMYAADVFVHPSYIDNSPNSVCEAQILGLPVISTNVGGISSLVMDGETGFLVPANDPYTMYDKILEVITSSELSSRLGIQGRKSALKRHDRQAIAERNLEIYEYIVYA